MNSLERVQTVMAGGIPDRVPVCLHNFMLAAREADIRMEDYRVDPEAIARAHLQAVEKYGAIGGAWRGVCRIGRCHPWHLGGYDPP